MNVAATADGVISWWASYGCVIACRWRSCYQPAVSRRPRGQNDGTRSFPKTGYVICAAMLICQKKRYNHAPLFPVFTNAGQGLAL